MFLEVIIDLFGNAIGIFILGFFGFIVLFYGLALVISVGIGLIIVIALNPNIVGFYNNIDWRSNTIFIKIATISFFYQKLYVDTSAISQ